jgi:hypothetical protein
MAVGWWRQLAIGGMTIGVGFRATVGGATAVGVVIVSTMDVVVWEVHDWQMAWSERR